MPQEVEGHTDIVSALAVSGDGRRVVSAGSQDETVRVWNVSAADPSAAPRHFRLKSLKRGQYQSKRGGEVCNNAHRSCQLLVFVVTLHKPSSIHIADRR